MNRTYAAILMSLSLAASPLIANAESTKPDATLEISGNSVAVGVGFTEAKGTLHYQGQSYPVHMHGVSLAQAGASNIEATGEVYHLNRLQDVSGNYAAASAGAAVVDGHTETTMKNQNGVVIKLHARTEGIDLRLAVDGVSVKLSQ